jgi:ABC-type uncharacterized transport system involved in gliding motility auxiliary subunit
MEFLNNIKTRTLVRLSILFSVLVFFSINIIINNVFNSSRIDFTEKKLYSLSNSTINLLKNLQEPIHIRLFVSGNLVREVPQLSTYANRVETMLKTYSNISNGKISLEIIDPNHSLIMKIGQLAWGSILLLPLKCRMLYILD